MSNILCAGSFKKKNQNYECKQTDSPEAHRWDNILQCHGHNQGPWDQNHIHLHFEYRYIIKFKLSVFIAVHLVLIRPIPTYYFSQWTEIKMMSLIVNVMHSNNNIHYLLNQRASWCFIKLLVVLPHVGTLS